MKRYFLLLFATIGAWAQTPTISVPVNFLNPTTGVIQGGIDGKGDITSSGTVSAGSGSAASGQILLMGAGTAGNGGSLAIQAPSAFLSGGSPLYQNWVLPSSAPPNGISILQFTNVGTIATMSYATLTGSQAINLTEIAGSLSIALSSQLNLGSGSNTINDSSGNPVISLISSGAGNYVQILNDTSAGSPPDGPEIISTGPGTVIPLRISDVGGGGVNLLSNGATALRIASVTLPVNYAIVDPAPGGRYGNVDGVQFSSADPGATADIALVLKAQNNGTVWIGSTLDTSGSAVAFELSVGAGASVPQFGTVSLARDGTALKASPGAHGVIGIAQNTVTPAAPGTLVVAYAGKTRCSFDGVPLTVGDYVVPSPTEAGRCSDGGATLPPGQVLGTLLNAATYSVLIRLGN
jgi:hypothetical protein